MSVTQNNPVVLFVAHSWHTDEDYLRVFEYLESSSNFFYRNVSQPDALPASGGMEAQRESLRRQIAPAEIVIATPGLAAANKDLLLFQMTFAKASNKPVALMRNFGAQAAVPKNIADLADVVVEWDARALVDEIKRQARHEESTRWDVIEFKLD